MKTYRCASEIKPETAYITAFFFRKEIWYFWGTNNLKTRLHCITMAKRTSRIAEEKKNSRWENRHKRKTELVEWMRRSKIYSDGEWNRWNCRRNEICLSKRRSGDYKKRFEQMKCNWRESTLYYGEKAATKWRRARLRVQLTCKGDGFIDKLKASKKGYTETRNGLNNRMFYREKQPRGLSKRLPTNKLKDLRS